MIPRILFVAVTVLGLASPLLSDTETEASRKLLEKALSHSEQGQFSEAEPLLRRVLALQERSFGADSLEVAATLRLLAESLYQLERFHEAEPLCRRALATSEKKLGPDGLIVARDLNNLAEVLRATDRLVAADPLYRRSLKIMEKELGSNHISLAVVLNNMGSLHAATGDFTKSEDCFRRGLAITEAQGQAGIHQRAAILGNLAVVQMNQEKLKAAERAVLQSIRCEENAGNLAIYAELLRRTKRPAEAAAMDAKVLALIQQGRAVPITGNQKQP